VNITNFRRDVEAFATGYTKHPQALKGVRAALTARETASLKKQANKIEQDLEKLEAALIAKKAAEQKFAKQASPKLIKSKKIARLYLEKVKYEDFVASHPKRKAAKKKATKKK
jgi:hypothetical protein